MGTICIGVLIRSHLNRATYSGFTPQYKGLEALYKKYKDRGFVILGFPCNQVRPSRTPLLYRVLS